MSAFIPAILLATLVACIVGLSNQTEIPPRVPPSVASGLARMVGVKDQKKRARRERSVSWPTVPGLWLMAWLGGILLSGPLHVAAQGTDTIETDPWILPSFIHRLLF